MIHKPWVEAKVIKNEFEKLTLLCGQGTHPHIVNVLRIGELCNTSYMFIDMELCDLSLVEYIHCTKPREAVPTFYIKDQPPPMRALQIWTVMLHIAKGVKYLHQKQIVHRDLKPANGYSYLTKHLVNEQFFTLARTAYGNWPILV